MEQLPLADQAVADPLLAVFLLDGGHDGVYGLVPLHQGLEDYILVCKLLVEIPHVEYDDQYPHMGSVTVARVELVAVDHHQVPLPSRNLPLPQPQGGPALQHVVELDMLVPVLVEVPDLLAHIVDEHLHRKLRIADDLLFIIFQRLHGFPLLKPAPVPPRQRLSLLENLY